MVSCLMEIRTDPLAIIFLVMRMVLMGTQEILVFMYDN